MNKKRYPKPRWQESGTWAGLAGVLLGASQMPTPAAPWLAGLAAMCGAVAMALREGRKEAAPAE